MSRCTILILLATLIVLTTFSFAQLGPDPTPGGKPLARPRTGTITGVLLAEGQKPMADARVELRAFSGVVVAYDNTRGNGSFQLDNVPYGSYELTAHSGLDEVHQKIELYEPNTFVSLSAPLANVQGASSGGDTVSVKQMQVPDKARKELEKARAALKHKKLEEAKKHINRSLEIAPGFSEALTLRAVFTLDENNPQAARADLEKSIQSDPSYALAYVVLGASYNAEKRYDEAKRVLDRAQGMSPNSWQVYFELSKAALGKGDFVSALRDVNQAEQRVSHDFAPLHLVRGYALVGLKKFGEAISELERYLHDDPDGRSALQAREALNQARALAAQGR